MFISMDLDDTLLRKNKSISDYSLKVLQKLKQLGHIIIINTARNKAMTKELIDIIKPDFVSVNAGCLIFDNNDNVIYSDPIDKEITNKLVKELLEYTSNISIQSYDTLFTTNLNNTNPNAVIIDNENYNIDAYKILPFKLDSNIALEKAKKYNLNYTSYFGGNWSRYCKEPNNKLTGLKFIVDFCNGSMDDTISFGDDYSDIPMIEGSYIGVAMSNGMEDVIRIAKYVCNSCDDDGVAKFLSKYFNLEV